MTTQPNAALVPILRKERQEGYSQGWGQAHQVCYDDAHEKGRREGFASGCKYIGSLVRWAFGAGLFVGGGAAWLIL